MLPLFNFLFLSRLAFYCPISPLEALSLLGKILDFGLIPLFLPPVSFPRENQMYPACSAILLGPFAFLPFLGLWSGRVLCFSSPCMRNSRLCSLSSPLHIYRCEDSRLLLLPVSMGTLRSFPFSWWDVTFLHPRPFCTPTFFSPKFTLLRNRPPPLTLPKYEFWVTEDAGTSPPNLNPFLPFSDSSFLAPPPFF